MSIDVFAQGKRATSITTIAVIGVMALLIAPSTPARAASRHPTPVLAQGAGMGAHPSAQVRVVQRALRLRGYDLGAPGVDGRFGPLTAAAVRQMQTDHALAVDGIVGDHTRHALGLARRTVDSPRPRPEQRATTVDERAPSVGHGTSRPATGGATTPRNAPMEPGNRSLDWVASFLVGALGGLIAFLSAMSVAAMRRRRDRPQTTMPLSLPLVAAESEHDHNGSAPASANGAPSDAPPIHVVPGQRVIGYVTVPAEAGASDADGAAQAINARCERSGWELVEIVRDREIGPTLERPALGYALRRIARGQASILVVSDVRRLSRSIVDLGALMAWFRNANATLVALDLGIDTSTSKGHRVASTLIALSDNAHERIAHRSRNGGSDVRADGGAGRPSVRQDPELMRRISEMRAANMTLQAIADQLNTEGVPTLRGGRKWRPSSIQAALGYRRPTARDHLPPLDRSPART